MCDYSLEHLAARPARVGEKLVSSSFPKTTTIGFAAVQEPTVAVCLSPGTELAFDREVKYFRGFWLFPKRRINQRVAQFRHVNENELCTHHDALEFPDGTIILLAMLCKGQQATVLQLPVEHSIEPLRSEVPKLASSAHLARPLEVAEKL
jgi:hypothetical protein